MKLRQVMLVMAATSSAAVLSLAGCHSAAPAARTSVYGSASDTMAVERALPAPCVHERAAVAQSPRRPAVRIPVTRTVPVHPVRRVVIRQVPAPVMPSFLPVQDACGAGG